MHGPLAGIRIIDLTRLLPGPFCTMLLGDMGAEVLKVEDPNGGDYARWAPPLQDGTSAYFLQMNRNKKSLTVNLKHPKGVELFMDLVPSYDAVIEQFRPGVCDRLGIGYEAVRKKNPTVIYASLTGYGQTGPYRDRAGHDLNYMGIAGAASITGVSGGPLVVPGVQVADIGAGALMTAIGLLAALLRRQKTGKGEYIDVSMLDGSVSWLAPHAANFFSGEGVPGPGKMRLNGLYICYRLYETKDGRWMSVCALEPKFWETFCRAVGKPHLITEQYNEGEAQEPFAREMEDLFRSKTLEEWTALFADKDAMCEPILDFAEAFEHPQVRARELVIEVDDPARGKQRQVGFPIKFQEAPCAVECPAPELGADTEATLRGIGYSKEKIAALREEKVI